MKGIDIVQVHGRAGSLDAPERGGQRVLVRDENGEVIDWAALSGDPAANAKVREELQRSAGRRVRAIPVAVLLVRASGAAK
jgi:hypothetical protein